LIAWGPFRVHGIFPKRGQAGFMRTVDGFENGEDKDGKTLRVFQIRYKWHAGLSLPDWRSAVRIANIDTSAYGPGSPPDLINPISEAKERIRGMGPKNLALYMSEKTKIELARQMRDKLNVQLSVNQAGVMAADMFDGIPVYKVDQLRNEPQITA